MVLYHNKEPHKHIEGHLIISLKISFTDNENVETRMTSHERIYWVNYLMHRGMSEIVFYGQNHFVLD